MRTRLAALAFLLASLPAAAQTPCGAGISVTVSPPVAAPGQVVTVTLTNQSSQDIELPSSCVFVTVYLGTTCTTLDVRSEACLTIVVPIAPGQSVSATWDQTDNFGLQVPEGDYSFEVLYSDAGFTGLISCCATLTITCPAASAQTRTGSGSNPSTLASLTLPRLGTSWDASLDCAAHVPGLAYLAVFDAPASGPLTPYGELLVGGVRLLRSFQPHSSSSVSFSAAIPPDLSLCGLQAFAQGVCFGAPGPRLSNALDLVLGS
jgi:hypothetical protein